MSNLVFEGVAEYYRDLGNTLVLEKDMFRSTGIHCGITCR